MESQPTWADMAASLLTRLSGGVELSCAFDHMELQVPNAQNPQGPAATWKLNGSLRIRTRGENPAAGPAPTPPALRIDPPAPSGRPQPTFEGQAPDSPPTLG
ncbi:hypothetical protein [uncultured Hymenobacter sp.]|uniref:hypothetical protein n=1 Tax=uncultured Hymenobacter sp. TaxID=170016 RepID=UPI0035CA94D8